MLPNVSDVGPPLFAAEYLIASGQLDASFAQNFGISVDQDYGLIEDTDPFYPFSIEDYYPPCSDVDLLQENDSGGPKITIELSDSEGKEKKHIKRSTSNRSLKKKVLSKNESPRSAAASPKRRGRPPGPSKVVRFTKRPSGGHSNSLGNLDPNWCLEYATGRRRVVCNIGGCRHACSTRGDLVRHQLSLQHSEPQFICPLKTCDGIFTRDDALKRHLRTVHKRK